MNVPTLLLAAAIAAGAATLLPRPPQIRLWGRRLHGPLMVASFAWLVGAFLASDLSLTYVWAHTRADHAWAYKLAGVWGGEEGTILLWATLVALASWRLGHARTPLDWTAGAFARAASTGLGLIALLSGVFDGTPGASLAALPDGRGLAPVLQTPLMVIHPPVQFIAYALLSVPAAYALAAMWRGSPPHEASAAATPWARAAFAAATLGLGLGAIWAYYVLSFGGFWAWDPVETANLLPWLATAAALHALREDSRNARHPIAAPGLAIAAFLLTLFATFNTRSGWWVSVHAFTDPTGRFEPDATLRLLAILDAHLPTRLFVGAFLGVIFAALALHLQRESPRLAWARPASLALLPLAGLGLLSPGYFLRTAFALGGPFGPAAGLGLVLAATIAAPLVLDYLARPDPKGRSTHTSRMTALATAILLLSLAVTLVLDVQSVDAPDRDRFDARAPYLALPLVLLITYAYARPPLGVIVAASLVTLGGLGSLVLAWQYPETRVAALAVAPVAVGTIGVTARIVQTIRPRPTWRARTAGSLLLLSGLSGLLFAANPPTRLLGHDIPFSTPLGAVAFAGAFVALLGAVAAYRQRGRAWAWVGIAGGILAVGYGAGAAAAMLAMPLVATARWDGASLWRKDRARLREVGVGLIHLAVLWAVLGYATSTYAQTGDLHTGVPADATISLADATASVGVAQLSRDASGQLSSIVAELAVTRADGSPDGTLPIAFHWSPADASYLGDLHVRRESWRDTYIIPLSFHTPDHGWTGAGTSLPSAINADDIDLVSFRVQTLPGMNLVWSGLWTLVSGIGLVIVTGRKL